MQTIREIVSIAKTALLLIGLVIVLVAPAEARASSDSVMLDDLFVKNSKPFPVKIVKKQNNTWRFSFTRDIDGASANIPLSRAGGSKTDTKASVTLSAVFKNDKGHMALKWNDLKEETPPLHYYLLSPSALIICTSSKKKYGGHYRLIFQWGEVGQKLNPKPDMFFVKE